MAVDVELGTRLAGGSLRRLRKKFLGAWPAARGDVVKVKAVAPAAQIHYPKCPKRYVNARLAPYSSRRATAG